MNSDDYERLVKIYVNAEDLVKTLDEVDAHPKLRQILREIAPHRSKIKGIPFKYVSLSQLLDAIKVEVGLAIKKIPGIYNPYKETEKRFRVNGGVTDVSSSVVAGALDFITISITYRDSGELPSNVVCILPPIGAPGRDEVLSAVSLDEVTAFGAGTDACPRSAGFFASTFAPLGIFIIPDKPGFYILPGALGSPEEQAFWTRRILRTYTEPPNRRNIDAFVDPDFSNIEWAVQYKQKLKLENPKLQSVVENTELRPELMIVGGGNEHSETASATAILPSISKQPTAQGHNGVENSSMQPVFRTKIWDEYVTWYTESQSTSTNALPSSAGQKNTRHEESEPKANKMSTSTTATKRPAFRDLAWATLGYQYDWTDRQYHLPSDPDYAQHISVHALAHGGSSADPATSPGLFEDPPTQPHRWYNHFPPLLSAWGTKLAEMLNTIAAHRLGVGELGEKEGDSERPSTEASKPVCPASTRTLSGELAGHFEQIYTAPGNSIPPYKRRNRKLRKRTDKHGLPMSLIPQAGITNFYQCGDKLPMGGHVDDMERTMDHPVLSISLGCSCIFLLGGDEKEDQPYPILLHSGDAMILSGSVRQAYHGVPRVFQDSTSPAILEVFQAKLPKSDGGPNSNCEKCNTYSVWLEHLSKAVASGSSYEQALQREFHANLPGCACEEATFKHYLNNARINLNVRQVR